MYGVLEGFEKVCSKSMERRMKNEENENEKNNCWNIIDFSSFTFFFINLFRFIYFPDFSSFIFHLNKFIKIHLLS